MDLSDQTASTTRVSSGDVNDAVLVQTALKIEKLTQLIGIGEYDLALMLAGLMAKASKRVEDQCNKPATKLLIRQTYSMMLRETADRIEAGDSDGVITGLADA